MAPSEDLKNHAASSHDFYALLNLSPAAADNEIRRAYRRTALKYHPDKIANPTPEDIDKFHLLQIAYDVLSEPSIRQLYDNAREARDRKKKESEMLEGVRRKMKEDLEARERGVKRPRASDGPVGGFGDIGGESAEDKLEREIRRLAEDGKRRRQAKEELMKKEVLEEEERRDREQREQEGGGNADGENSGDKTGGTARVNTGGTAVPEIDRTVKVRWVREGRGLDIDKDSLQSLFSTFGDVESAFTLKDKRQRIGEKREKKVVATGVAVFSSIVGAHAAVEDSKKQKGAEWDIIESVFWAGNKEPEHLAAQERRPQTPNPSQSSTTAPSTPNKPTPFSKSHLHDFPGLNSAASTPSTEDNNKKGVRKVPSFASFSSAQTPNGSPAGRGAGLGPNSPSLEEITLIRLKNAERKRLEEQIRSEDEAAAAAEAEGK